MEIARLQKYQKIVRHESRGNPTPPREVERHCQQCGSANVKLTVLQLQNASSKRYWFCYDCGTRTKVS